MFWPAPENYIPLLPSVISEPCAHIMFTQQSLPPSVFFFFLCGSFPEVVLCTLHLMGIPQFFALLLLLDICVMQVLCLWCGNTPPVTLSVLVAIVALKKIYSCSAHRCNTFQRGLSPNDLRIAVVCLQSLNLVKGPTGVLFLCTNFALVLSLWLWQ